VVNDATTGANENINSTSKLVGLLPHVATSVNCEDIELIRIELESGELLGNLKSELSCGGQNHGLRLSCAEQSLATKALDHGETEAQGFSGASQVSHHQVFSVVNFVEGFILNWEESGDATGDQALDSVLVNFREV